MLRPSSRRRRTTWPLTRIGAWWRRQFEEPLDQMYEQLDEHQQDDGETTSR